MRTVAFCSFGAFVATIGALHADFRGVEFDEDVEGFQFSRVTSKKTRPSRDAIPKLDPTTENSTPQQSARRGRPRKKPQATGNDGAEDARAQSPEVAAKKSTRTNTKATAAQQETPPEDTRAARKHDLAEVVPSEKKRRKGRPAKSKPEEMNGYASPDPQHSNTAKISLPMADTPVMQRNKEMRTKKSEKGSRRSSLGMRGRRASSLIDSGASNGGYHLQGLCQSTNRIAALPHKEVDAAEFYKHIASDLPEPRRMRQLLIWCATRAMGDKPSGSRSEDESARLAGL
jgi:kinetochore protein Mis13/DSN1